MVAAVDYDCGNVEHPPESRGGHVHFALTANLQLTSPLQSVSSLKPSESRKSVLLCARMMITSELTQAKVAVEKNVEPVAADDETRHT